MQNRLRARMPYAKCSDCGGYGVLSHDDGHAYYEMECDCVKHGHEPQPERKADDEVVF